MLDEEITRSAANITNMTSVLKCCYHPAKDAKYLVELKDEDILCCL